MQPSDRVLQIALTFGPDWSEEKMRVALSAVWSEVEPRIQVEITQDQTDALASLAVDVLRGGVGQEKLFWTQVIFNVNLRFWQLAAGNFSQFCVAGGKILPALVRKRIVEQEFFLGSRRPT